MAIPLNLAECTPKFRTEKHLENPETFQYLNATLTHPVLGQLATARCLKILGRMRFKNTGDFLEVMDEESQELHEFSMGLFDRNSNIRPWLVDGGAKSGSGCWGTELSVGDMMYVEEVRVKEEFRSRGVGSWLLQKILTSSRMGKRGHAFCWPTPIGSTVDKAEWTKEQAIITAFYRKNGFRRIGLTPFLAYSPSPSHPSRKLPISSDPETPSISFESTNPTTPNLCTAELHAQYPLYHAIATNKTPSIAQIIRASHLADGGSVHTRDVNGFTPVHVAAASENANALRALLALDPSGIAEVLKDGQNKDGITPLEGLESSMRSTRECMETLVGVWKGYRDEALSCEYLLKKAMGLPMMAVGEGEYIKKRRFGCTCGVCTNGWLSPRMRFRLLAQAEILEDMLRMDLSTFRPAQLLSTSNLFHPALEYIPPTLRRHNKPFYIGVSTILDGIAHVLKTPSGIPTPEAVMTAAMDINAGAVQFYMGKGGRVEYVLDAVVDVAKGESSLGDGTFEDTFDHEEGEEGGQLGYKKLERCANDLEFGGVRLGVGIGDSEGFAGPYVDREEFEEDEMDVDWIL